MKKNQPGLYAQLKNLPWRQVPVSDRQAGRGHGRQEQRSLQAVTVAAGLAFPHAAQAIRVTRRTRPLGGGTWHAITVYAITSLSVIQAAPAQIAGWIRGHWQIEALHHIRSPGVLSPWYDIAPAPSRRAFATRLRRCGARCRCCSNACCRRTGRFVQHVWCNYPVLINR